MKKLMILCALVLLVAGCQATKPRPCEPVDCIPQPYWDPPTNIEPLPADPLYQIESLPPLTRESSDSERARFLAAFMQDHLACRGDSKAARALYEALERRIQADVPEPVE